MTTIPDWLHALPKAELHLHLEGAIPLDALWALVEKHGGDASVPNRAALRERLTYPDFPAFIDAWVWKNGFLKTAEDFTFIAEAVARDLARQNILYAEFFFSPSRFADQGLSAGDLAQAIRRGLDRVPECETWLIPDLVRDHGPENAARTLAEIKELTEYGIVGVGMGGSEHVVPPEPFAPVYEEARRLGLKTSVHAGEAAGAESVRGAAEVLRVDRIGHATRAEEDPALIDLLSERQIALELCPLSNVATGSIKRIEDHPARRYMDRGLNISINTDDPGMFHNSMAEEYAVLIERFGFTADEIRRLVLNALDASWRPEVNGPSLRDSFQNHPGWRLA
ncbi:MAG: adenosine deaminase [Alphaproteobacteria bacterium]|jgi:adenosine deaminase|nr:adenosine deaminase [Alphaproteobacteria bacterium]